MLKFSYKIRCEVLIFMKLKKLFAFVIVGSILFLGGINCMAIKGHGYDERRLAEFGWFKKDGVYVNKYTENRPDKQSEYDWYGFDRFGINKDTNTRFDKNGFDWDGYDKYGTWSAYTAQERLSDKGYSHRGFDIDGNYITGGKYDKKGFDVYRFDRYGIHAYTKTKWDHDGYNAEGRNSRGYPRGYRKTGAK